MSVKSIVKFVVSLTSLLKKVPIIFKILYFYKILDFLLREMGLFLVEKFFIYCGTLGLGLEPALS